MKVVSKRLYIFSNYFVHFGHGIGTIEMKFKQMEPQYIKNIGNWKPYTQDDFYSDSITIRIMKVMSGSSEK